ncbi:MAG: hypothetical protein M3313_04195, partial [Actinomycetota bacterium]|nr:hypothetical protein [Actinomycetota bacterium]
RGTELLYDSATGRFRGDAGDALLDVGRAGARSFVQGIGEGAGEAFGQGVHTRRLVAAADAINRARGEMGLSPLVGDPLHEDSPLRTAAEDLMFLNQHGRHGGDRLGRAVNLDHVATHRGLGAPVATVRPSAIVDDAMRAELMRHVPPELHGTLAQTPIRVLPEAEYRALTRSESGPVVTLIEDGRPVVVVREGTPIARLADEGPHLVQARDAHLRQRVARLDEATLARWDSLDLDTQLDLYRTKIDLEIDAHQRIHDSLEAELRSGDATESDQARLAADLDSNTATLRNLGARNDEIAGISPEQRAAIAAGEQSRPQYLEQPARLFSKDEQIRPGTAEADKPPTPGTEPPEGHQGATTEETKQGTTRVVWHPAGSEPEVVYGRGSGMPAGEQLTMYAQAVRSAAGRNPATAAAGPGPFIEGNLYTGKRQTRVIKGLTEAGILTQLSADRFEVGDPQRYVGWLERAYQLHVGIRMDPRVLVAIERYIGRGPLILHGVDPDTGKTSAAGSLPGTHAEILAVNQVLASGQHSADVATVRAAAGEHFIACVHCAGILRQLSPSVRIATGEARPGLITGATVEVTDEGITRVVWHSPQEPEVTHGRGSGMPAGERAPVPRAVLEHAERAGASIRDPDGRTYSLAHPDSDDGVLRASASTPEAHADAMREALMRHVPPEQREA